MSNKRVLWEHDVFLEEQESLENLTVFQEELVHIEARRNGKYIDINNSTNSSHCDLNIVGLALSGGGIRSAIFGLGVLEALKEQSLLEKVDYLSTVSGGGYIGAWLSTNCKRAVECDIRVYVVKDEKSKQESINQFKTEIMPGNGCSLCLESAKDNDEIEKKIKEFKLEFESKKKEGNY